MADSRNFHAWSYWRWLAGRMQLPAAESLAYTAQKLRENFSNYSAWHARTTLLPAAATPPQVPTLAQMLAEEAGGPSPRPHTLPSGAPAAAACASLSCPVSLNWRMSPGESAGAQSSKQAEIIKPGRDPCQLGCVTRDACLVGCLLAASLGWVWGRLQPP